MPPETADPVARGLAASCRLGLGLARRCVIRVTTYVVLCAAILATPDARGQAAPDTAPHTAPGPGAAAAATIAATPDGTVSIDDVRAFIEGYAHAVNGRDEAAVNAALDAERLIQRAHRELDIPPALLRGFSDGIRSGLNWGRSMVNGLGESGHYRLLKVRDVDGRPRALLRMVNGQGGLNYHDVLVERDASGRLVIVDVHVYLAGELLSEVLRRSLRQIVAATKGGDEGYLASLRLLETMSAQTQAGEWREALATYRRMPEKMRRDKTVLIMRISCATEVDRAELDDACRDFRATFPDDPCVDLLTIDQMILHERWDEAIAGLRRIVRIVGEDAYIDDLMANIHLQAGRIAEARTLARRSVDRDPALDEGYWTLLEIAVRRQDHDATARLLTTLEEEFGWEFKDLAAVESYAHFVASPAYASWKAARRTG